MIITVCRDCGYTHCAGDLQSYYTILSWMVGLVDLEFSWCITLATSLQALQATLYVTAVASSWRWQATLSLWWQVDVDVRPHYHCGGKLMLMSGHIITVVANWCRCQATLLLSWQGDGDVRPHYYCCGKLMEMSGHIITVVASWWRCQATLSLWWQVDVGVRPHYHSGGKLM